MRWSSWGDRFGHIASTRLAAVPTLTKELTARHPKITDQSGAEEGDHVSLFSFWTSANSAVTSSPSPPQRRASSVETPSRARSEERGASREQRVVSREQ